MVADKIFLRSIVGGHFLLTSDKSKHLPVAATLNSKKKLKSHLYELPRILDKITRLTLLLDGLHDQCERGCSRRIDREIGKITAQLNQTYDDAIRAKAIVGSHYSVKLVSGTTYTLCLTQWGVECRAQPTIEEQVS